MNGAQSAKTHISEREKYVGTSLLGNNDKFTNFQNLFMQSFWAWRSGGWPVNRESYLKGIQKCY